MNLAEQGLDEDSLSNLSPLNLLSGELLNELMGNCSVDRVPPGRRIFNVNDRDNRTLFLLSGQLALVADGHAAITLKADSNEACQPIAEQQPRQVTALASTSVSILSMDSEFLHDLLRRSEEQGLESSGDGVDRRELFDTVFTGALFTNLPEPHKQVLLRRMVEMPVSKGQIIINEGDRSKYYYLIVKGTCRVTRHIGGSFGQNVLVADLGPGSGFGEGALIENDFHDSTVEMQEDGILLRLSKGEFLTLLVRPFVKWIQPEDVEFIQAEGAVLLDIRTPASYQRMHLDGSINLPLIVLRKAVSVLDPNRHYIVCCDVGRRSATAAFLLNERGISVSILEGGIRKAVRGD